MSASSHPPPIFDKFQKLKEILKSMNDQEIFEAAQQVQLHISMRFSDSR